MPKQNFGAGTGVPDPPRQGEKGGKGGTIGKGGGNTGGAGEAGESAKSGKGAGTRTGGVSDGKATGGTERVSKGDNPTGKGSGNR